MGKLLKLVIIVQFLIGMHLYPITVYLANTGKDRADVTLGWKSDSPEYAKIRYVLEPHSYKTIKNFPVLAKLIFPAKNFESNTKVFELSSDWSHADLIVLINPKFENNYKLLISNEKNMSHLNGLKKVT